MPNKLNRRPLAVLALSFYLLCGGQSHAQSSQIQQTGMREQLASKLKSAKPQSGQVTVLQVGHRPSKKLVQKSRVAAKPLKAVKRKVAAKPASPPKPSFGQLAGLQATPDPLELKSNVAYVIDQNTQEVLVSKNDAAVLPIASLTKLMTGLLVSEAKSRMDEPLAITQADVDTEKGSRSRLKVGMVLTRGELLHLALMSSENRAAHALARNAPGGLDRFISQMNDRARSLGMRDTLYVEPTGLSSKNQSSAKDLAMLAQVASVDPLLREYTTSPGYSLAFGRKILNYNNTNRLVHNESWDIGLQKTGYISEAGRCLLMQANVGGRKLIMVFLDSVGTNSRLGDAERVRRWVEANYPVKNPT
jgi:serine-type D-Ala-D-Ala endopeptidase (penicillin-binding protein 7)